MLRLLNELRAREAQAPGRGVRASSDELAQALGVSRRTVQRCAHALKRGGLVGVTRAGAGRYDTNNYTLL